MEKQEVRKIVREGYAKVAKGQSRCCDSSCCPPGAERSGGISLAIGYTDEELKQVPEGANLGLGCGNPIALASLKKGDVVLDLGSGAGIDCFLAAGKVGEEGRVIGVDMTPEMIDRARANARRTNVKNVEFRLGEIENLPVADRSVDLIISNCVINLSPDKPRVFQEAFRVLKSGGRLSVSDIVLLNELPDWVRNSVAAYVGCISGALLKADYLAAVKEAGFQDVRVVEETHFPVDLMASDPTAQALLAEHAISVEKARELEQSIVSIKLQAVKALASR